MNPDNNIETLFQKLLENECSPDEVEELVKHIAGKNNEKSEELILKQLEESVSPGDINEEVKRKLELGLERILDKRTPGEKLKTPVRRIAFGKRVVKISMRYAAAIALVFLTGIAWYVVKDSSETATHITHEIVSNPVPLDFEPGSSRAILMTEDGNTVYLDETMQDKSVYQGVAIIKPEEGSISYNDIENSGVQALRLEEIVYNTIVIPRGGRYKVTLSDGTKVWLNAASSLKFPEVFKGTERVVELTGEGYFEVAKNAEMPFKVKLDGVEVNVLGTHFNVNGYSDNGEVKTTLLEGSVRISTGREKAILKPGEQVSYKGNRLGSILSGVNMEQVVAWKNDNFDFTNESLQGISKQLSRWYQVEMSIDETIATKHMSGIISRQNNLSKVLEILEISAGISSKIDGEKVFLYKK